MFATEEPPRNNSPWGVMLYSGSKTDPGPLLEDEINLSSSFKTPLTNFHTTGKVPITDGLNNGVCSLMPISDPSLQEDPESDTSSGSDRSASSVSTPSVPWEGYGGAWETNISLEDCSHMPYASHMRMSEFRREQHRFNWETLSQAIVHKLYPHWPKAQEPRQIDLFYYLRLIGGGSSSSVYAAVFEGFGLNDALAVKLLDDCRRNPTTGLPREFQIMQGLNHNHIVAFVGSFTQEQNFGVLMYPLAPYDLAQYLREISDSNSGDRKRHQTRTKMLLTAFGCLSSALFYLHVKRNIKHKDIKPENILVDRYGSVLLADFGISKQYQGDTSTSEPTPFTEKYAAPEVAAQIQRDLSADVFSLGCVFLEMATVILGESLKTLDGEVFGICSEDLRSKKAYQRCLPEVEIWISRLKAISLHEGSPLDSCPYSPPSETGAGQYEQITGKFCLRERHLDTILAMMSKSPSERPSTQDLYNVFIEFAENCAECPSRVNFLSECQEKEYSSKKQQLDTRHPHAKPSALVKQEIKRFFTEDSEGTAIVRRSKQACGHTSRSQQNIKQNIIEASNSQTKLLPCGYVAELCDQLYILKDSSNRQLASDGHEDDDGLSEADKYYSDFDDEDVITNSASRELWHRVKSLVSNLLEKSYKEGKFNCCVSGESTSNGSTQSGSSSKRRSVGQGRVVAIRPPSDHPDGSDEEEQDQSHGQENEEKKDMLPPRQWFACQYFQRDRDRCTHRSCSGPGWFELHRLKEHLMRTHRIYICDRCQEVFRKNDDLKGHRRNVTPCPLQDKVPDDEYDWAKGFNEDQANELKVRMRKRQRTAASDRQKWEEWFKILFPKDSNIPSPYYNNDTNLIMSELVGTLSTNLHNRVDVSDWLLIDSCIQETVEDFTRQRLQPQERSTIPNLNSPENQNSLLTQTNYAQQRNHGRMSQPTPYNPTWLQRGALGTSQNFATSSFEPQLFHPQQLLPFQLNNPGNETDDSACYADFDALGTSSRPRTTFLEDQSTGVDYCGDPHQNTWEPNEDFDISGSLFRLPNEEAADQEGAEEHFFGLELPRMGSSQHRHSQS